MRPDPQPIRLVDQQIDPLAALEHPLDILRHDPLHAVDVLLHVGDGILLARLRGAERHHQAFQLGVEIRRAVRRQAGEIGDLRVVPLQELLFDLDEIAEGDTPPEGGGGDDYVCESASGGVAHWVV